MGLNDLYYLYIQIEEDMQKSRYQLAMNAYKATFMRTDGAMTSTRMPHTEAIEGIVVTSETNFPVPIISPLKDGFAEEIESLVKKQKGLTHQKFINFTELFNIINELGDKEIFKLAMPGGK
ncbi:MAG: hypothetical protein QXY90_05495 [Candidatus Anstonellales archaeon]